jgi:phosphoadenosine phosphosulfate reductase
MEQLKTALQFSGGRDSQVILHLFHDRLDEILVTWVNTGAAYSGVIELMEKTKQSVPHFLEVHSDQPKQIAQFGYPADVIPLHLTAIGHIVVKGDSPIVIQDSFHCCRANIWEPMRNAMQQRGITTIIRGQRRAEKYTAPMVNGCVDNGITYLFPLEDWTDEDVSQYFHDNNMRLPVYYENEGKSHDCWSCTGYLDEDHGRISHLPIPQRLEVMRRLHKINKGIGEALAPLKQLLDESAW